MKTLCNWPQSRSARVLTAMFVLTVFGTLAASVTEAQTYALSVSASSNHSTAIALQGATISGNVYVFTSSAANLQNYDPSGISTVCYWLDNPSRTGPARHCESYMPYDFISSVNNTPTSLGNPWNTTQVANGTHTITQAVTKSAGGSEVDTATFTINNSTASAALQSVSVNPSSVIGGQSSTGTVTLTKAAPSGGALVSLSSNNAAAQVGASVTVPANASSTTFKITTSAVSVSTPVTISGVYEGVTKTATLTVGVSKPAATFSANPTTIPLGQSSILTWTTTNATSVSIDNGIGAVATSGSVAVKPGVNTTYTLTATGTGGTASASVTVLVGTATLQHFEYVLPDQNLYVYDMDNNFQLLKHVSIPQAQGIRGVGAVPGTNMLYISYGNSGGNTSSIPGTLLAYDLLNDTVAWTKSYTFGVDSFDITPDGKTIYMPVGDSSSSGVWEIIDAATGNVTGNINTGWSAAHDTVVSLDGAYVFMGPHSSPELVEGGTAAESVVRNIGPLKGGVSPFTINGKHTLAFTTGTGNYLGFQVGDTTTGAVLYTVSVSGFSVPPGFAIDPPDHGISLSPDETQIYLIDTANTYLHVFDVSGLPSTAPTQVANIPLTTQFTGNQSPCTYQCTREGWIRHTSDGQYVLVGDSGNVISTSTQQVIATLPQLYNTRVFIGIDWQNGLPISTSTRVGKGYVTQ